MKRARSATSTAASSPATASAFATPWRRSRSSARGWTTPRWSWPRRTTSRPKRRWRCGSSSPTGPTGCSWPSRRPARKRSPRPYADNERMRYYPVFLDIAGKPVVVIGGGEVALRKVEGLLDAGARVTVVSPALHPGREPLGAAGKVRHIGRPYQPGDVEGYALVIVGTDDRSANEAVAREGKERGVWVNAVGDPPNCDFIMPGVVSRGGLLIPVSTSGGSPAMARKMREQMETFLRQDCVP